MPGQTGYHALVDALARTPASDPSAFLSALRATYGLTQIIYADVERHGETFRQGQLIHTPNQPLERLIRNEGFLPLTPLFSAISGLFGPQVMDPRPLGDKDPQTARTLTACDLARPMLVFPLVPSRPGVAFFMCNSNEMQGWPQPVEILLRDITALAGLFHAKQLAAAGVTPQARHTPGRQHQLTPREREVLQWVAEGKTYWEIARILGISERTVRHFMANCREKLDAVSNKQAVARAVAGNLINIRHGGAQPLS